MGLIGLIKSIDTFNMSKKAKFSSYATKCINNEILMFLKKGKKFLKDASLESSLNTIEDMGEFNIGDTLIDENADLVSDYEQKEKYNIIRKIIANLPERDKALIILSFGFIDNNPLSQRQIANKLNISQSTVSREMTRLLKYIKDKLIELGVSELSINEQAILKENKKHGKTIKKSK